MATLITNANGNLTGAATFAATETGALATALARNTTFSIASAASVTSVTFTVTSGKVIDGALLYVAQAVIGAYTGTFKVDLQKSGVSQASVTVNKTDLPLYPGSTTVTLLIPFFFKFTGTATGDGTATWTLVLTTTGNLGINYAAATASGTNLTRALRTTTAATPAAGDDLYIIGELTGAGTNTPRTVTMDSIATTAYGNGALNSTTVAGGGIHIASYGTLSYGTAASTNYVLRVNGDVTVYQLGTLNVGSSGAEIPRTSTAVLEFQQFSADGDFGLRCLDNAVVNIAGLSRTLAKNVVQCKLTSNVAAAGTTWNVNTDTGWLSTDQVCVASTTRTNSECELITLSGNASAGSFTGSAGAVNAHNGTAPTQAEIGLLTRNVRIRSTSTTLMAYVYCTALSTVTASWAEFYYLGHTVANKRGIEIDGGATTNPKSFTYCSLHDIDNWGLYCNANGVTSLNMTFSNNVIWNSLSQAAIYINGAVTNTDWTFDFNLIMRPSTYGINLGDLGGTFTNNTVVGAANYGILLAATSQEALGTFDGNVVHAGAGVGLTFQTVAMSGTISNFTAWRNSSSGIAYTNSVSDIVFTNLALFGNGGAAGNFAINTGDTVTIRSGLIAADTSFAVTNGLVVGASIASMLQFNLTNVDMSGSGSIYAPHTTNDIFSLTSPTSLRGVFNNCKFGAPNLLSTKSVWTKSSYLGFEKYNQTAGDHRTEMTFGQLKTDSVVYHTAAPSMRMTSNNASNKLESAPLSRGMLVAVNSGSTATTAVYLRKDVTYFGNQPRLIVRANPAVGITADTVLATATGLNSTTLATFDGTPSAGIVLSNGNLTVTHGTTNNGAGVASTTLLSTGKYYFEVTWTLVQTSDTAGIMPSGGTIFNLVNGTIGTSVGFGSSTNIISNGVSTGKNLGTAVLGDVIGFAIDLTNRLAWIRRNNGSWNADGTANPATGVGGVTVGAGAYSPAVGFSNNNAVNNQTANFGQTAYVNAAPSGFGNWLVPPYTGTGTWNALSGTTIAATDAGVMEFIIDCDGTAGFINVDDWTASTS